ncbi:hypothetical protein ACHAXR_004552 [Thalassiosira sp. AJA248-18]
MKLAFTAGARLLLSIPTMVAQPFAYEGLSDEVMFHILKCFTPCNNGYTGNEVIPGTGCIYYHECWEGEARSRNGCGAPLVFNVERDYCDFASNVDCPDFFECPDTFSPTRATTKRPTLRPSQRPTALPTVNPTVKPVAPEEIITSTPGANPNENIAPSALSGTPPEDIPTTGRLFVFMLASYSFFYSLFHQCKMMQPAEKPTLKPTNIPISVQIPNAPTQTSKPVSEVQSAEGKAIPYIESKKDIIEKNVLVSYNSASGIAYPSTQYTFSGLMQSLQVMGVAGFGAYFKFRLEGDDHNWVHGLVNLAAFLANCMVESIEYDTCDELNWQIFEGKHAISNSCGQEGRSYQDENCVLGTTEFLSCDVDSNMYVTAVTSGTQVRAPPPLKCKPGNGDENYAGYWDFSIGREVTNAPSANVDGRTDIEGCCWWGRGALLTRGICNIGKLNYYLGKRGADMGRSTLFPRLDFCTYPEVTCTTNGEKLRWITALFEWSERVQRYEALPSSTEGDGWKFEDQIAQFIAGGMASDSFIIGISRILSRGCHKSGCSGIGEVRMLNKRKSHFFMIVNDVFDLKSLLETPKPTSKPTRQPSQRPTNAVLAVPVVSPPSGSPPDQMAPSPVDVPTISPPAGSPSQQQITMPITPNPIEVQQINPSPTEPSWVNVDPAPVVQPGQPLSNSGTVVDEPTSWADADPSSPVAQPGQPSSQSGTVVDEPTSFPTYKDNAYDAELIGIEGNVAGRASAKEMFKLNLLVGISVLYYHIII